MPNRSTIWLPSSKRRRPRVSVERGSRRPARATARRSRARQGRSRAPGRLMFRISPHQRGCACAASTEYRCRKRAIGVLTIGLGRRCPRPCTSSPLIRIRQRHVRLVARMRCWCRRCSLAGRISSSAPCLSSAKQPSHYALDELLEHSHTDKDRHDGRRGSHSETVAGERGATILRSTTVWGDLPAKAPPQVSGSYERAALPRGLSRSSRSLLMGRYGPLPGILEVQRQAKARVAAPTHGL